MDETTKAKIEGMVRRCEELASMALTLKASLESLLVSLDGVTPAQSGVTREIVQEFPMRNPDALNRGPLRWLLGKLEEEQAKGHVEAWHSFDATAVRFTVRLKPEATPEDREKIKGWFAWVRRRLGVAYSC